MKGRPPKPTTLHKLQGTFVKNRHTKACTAAGDIGSPPRDMTADQKQLWRRIVAAAPPGLLTPIDRSVLAVFVEAADRHRMASIAQAELPLAEPDPRTGELRASPYLRELRRAGELVLRAAQELGFSPVSRSRVAITLPVIPDETENSWAKLRLLQGGRGERAVGAQAPHYGDGVLTTNPKS